MASLKVLQITLIVMLSIFSQSQGKMVKSRKLDETSPPDLENRCGGCPCNNPCDSPPSLPPPSPPPPSPPPPSPSPPPPPPPAPKKPPPSSNCPPPPSGGQYPSNPNAGQYPPSPPYMYMNGPPGNLYPVDSVYSGSSRRFSVGLLSPLSVAAMAFGLLVFY